jgi:hypothetical protein
MLWSVLLVVIQGEVEDRVLLQDCVTDDDVDYFLHIYIYENIILLLILANMFCSYFSIVSVKLR